MKNKIYVCLTLMLLAFAVHADAATIYSQNFDAAGQAALSQYGAGGTTAAPSGWHVVANGADKTNIITISNGTSAIWGGVATGYYATGDAIDYSFGMYKTGANEDTRIMFVYTATQEVTNISITYDFESSWARFTNSTARTAKISWVGYRVNNSTFPPVGVSWAWGTGLGSNTVTNANVTSATTWFTDAAMDSLGLTQRNRAYSLTGLTLQAGDTLSILWGADGGGASEKNMMLGIDNFVLNGTYTTAYGGGSGTAGNPYLIYTAAQMNTIGTNTGDWDKCFKLMADIDMSAYTSTQYNIIGNSVSSFRGTFDGNHHIISNLTYTTTSNSSCAGLFGSTSLATITNLGLTNVSISSDDLQVGGLVGNNMAATITGCYVTGSVSGANEYSNIGGLVGQNFNGTITNCYADVSVSGYDNVGGLVGSNAGGTLNGCYASGSVDGHDNVGGLVGNNYGPISNCYSAGSVNRTGYYAGGLVGLNWGPISNCYSTGSVEGGIDGDYVGGLTANGPSVINSFWNSQTSGQTSSTSGKSRTTAQMKQAANYAGWNTGGETIWTINEGSDYPRLAWESKPGTAIPSASFSDTISGSGTEGDPYVISTAQQLNTIGLYPSEWDKYYNLTANIDMAAYTGAEYNIIGVIDSLPFTGAFNGNGHIISNLTCGTSSTSNVGMFGYSTGQVNNLGLADVNITGSGYVGGLVGSSYGDSITSCYVTGSVSGNTSVGVLAGWIGGTLTNSYASGSVNAIGDLSYDIGGLAGGSSGSISNCYSTVLVSELGDSSEVGGIVGNGPCAVNSFWDSQTSEQTSSASGKPRTTVQMKQAANYAGWNTGGQTIWTINEGSDYPRLAWESKPGTAIPSASLSDTISGSGTEGDPYLITTAQQLNTIGLYPNEWSNYYSLTADIDMDAYSGAEYNVIGITDSLSFTGTFNGNGHIISNLTCGTNTTSYVGMFGASGGQISNLELINLNITGYDYVGGLVGSNSGSLTACYASGLVSGGDYCIGGLAGSNSGSISNCYSTGSVSGTGESGNYAGGLVGQNSGNLTSSYSTCNVSSVGSYVGGLIGQSYSGTITNCYAGGSVSGIYSVGGLIGSLSHSISKCYSTGLVSCDDSVGGLIGYKLSGSVTGCFWDNQTSGKTTSSGGTGKTTVQMKTLSTFTAASWNFTAITGNWQLPSSDYPRLIWETAPSAPTNVSATDGTYTNKVTITWTASSRTSAYDVYRYTSNNSASSAIILSNVTGTSCNDTSAATGVTYWYWVKAKNIIGASGFSSGNSGYRDIAYGGAGTSGDPYLIYTAAEMNAIGTSTGDWNKCFKLMADIDMSAYTGTQYNIIGSSSSPFIGKFDGNNHIISNLTYTTTGAVDNIGLFGYTSTGSEIKDLGLENVSISSSGNFVGGLVGQINSGTITNCDASGSVSATGASSYGVGGLVGYNESGSLLTGCSASGSASATGLSSYGVGGLVGYNLGIITSCYASSSATAPGDSSYLIGGLVGSNESTGAITNCYASGSVSGGVASYYVGGLAGGNSGTVTKSYATGSVNGGSNVGGLAGSNDSGTVTACFWDITTSSQSIGVGNTDPDLAIGKTTAEMKILSTFTDAGWNFTAITGDWQMSANDYPRLIWEEILSAPSVPADVSATDGAYTDKVTITWSAASGATAYDVYRFTSDNSGSASAVSSDIAGTSLDDTTTVAGTTYYYWVKAKNAGGTSDFSTGDSGYRQVLPPSAPANVSATDGSHTDKVALTWSAASGATAYDVYRFTSDNSGSASAVSSDIAGTSLNDTTAVAGTTYYYWVKAKNAGGSSDFSTSDSGYRQVLPPSAPTNVSATDGSYTDKVALTWSAASGATAYDVYRYTSNNSASASVISSDVAGTSLNDTSAVAGTSYYYWVKAKNAGGTSDFSTGDSGYRQVLPPSAPTNVSATDGNHTDKVALTWTAAAGATAYDVYRFTSDDSGSASAVSSDIAGTSLNDTTAVAGTTYYYWVKAKNAGGTSDFSTSDSGYRQVLPPSAPANVSATDGTHTDKVAITWSAASGATAYDVYRFTSDNSASSEAVSSDIAGTSLNDTTAVAGTTYHYWVKAKNAGGTSDFSTGDSGYRQVLPPSAPANVLATDGTYTDKVTITWSASSGATAYDVYRFTSSNSASSEVISSDIAGTSYNDTTTVADTTYWYWVKAKNAGGTSGFSSGNSGYKELEPPSAPTDISATDGTHTDKVALTWSAASGATAYDVYRFTSNDSSSASAVSFDIAGTSYNDTSAVAGTTYYYWVKAKNAGGTSDFSTGDSGYRQVLPPSAPTGVSATDGTYTDKVIIAWTASSGAAAYDVYRYTSDNSAKSVKINSSDIAGTSYSDTTAVAGTTYYYWVKAKNAGGTSAFSTGNTGYKIMPPVAISGYVKVSGKTAMPGVTITASNDGGTTTTDTTGYYQLMVPYNWTGQITPTMEGYSFVSSLRSYKAVTAEKSLQNYKSYGMQTISGYIKTSRQKAVVSAVTVTASNGGGTTTTDATGYYEVAVPYGWSGTVTPTKTGYSFVSPSRPYSSVKSSKTLRNFIAFEGANGSTR